MTGKGSFKAQTEGGAHKFSSPEDPSIVSAVNFSFHVHLATRIGAHESDLSDG